ncbi:DUF2280 domain-containing protein [Sinorhizobium meliloti]|uniref:DUF2280 domain-containing protein n=1 Tax=Rhizobium meliloti TaxID=382 RepID=UPI000FD5860E|nr:DUF2280 domain-containing protein [Sinorhizobium meliloti]RVN82672.1 DUF2280 domain-containing protein [Sinorhizobium meliloti]RVO16332.1 DUF2280 domain-containing protein [Sinorhizobium meliloti]
MICVVTCANSAPKQNRLTGRSQTFLEDTATIAISDRAVRLRALQRKAENRARCRGVIA